MCWIWTHKWWLYIRSTIWGKLTSKKKKKKHQNNLFFLFLFFFYSFFSLIVIVQLKSLKWTFLRNPHHQTHCARKGILAVLQHSEFNLKQQQQLLRWCLISKQQNLIITDLSWYSGAPVITAAWITICIDVIKSKCLFVNTAYDKGSCVLKDRFQKLSRSN